jgi:glycosyltransferase involved in cell wall biosynthesis
MRIGHLTTIPASQRVLLGTEIDHLVHAGHDVVAIAGPADGDDALPDWPSPARPRVAVVPSLTRRADGWADVRALIELVGLLRRLRLDVLHAHMPKTGWIGRVAGRLAGVPVVVNTCHGLYARQARSIPAKVVALALEAVTARLSDAELFQNGDDYALMRRWEGRRKCRVIGNGIDLARWRPDGTGRDRVRAELAVADGELLVGGVGRLIEHKGVREFGAAAERLRERARFVWVGPEERVKSSRVVPTSSAVSFLGPRADMLDLYSALDVFVLPSYTEGLPRSAMEAAACGVPLVLTDVPGCRELGIDGVHARFVPPRDVDALTAAVAELIDSAEQRRELARRACARARATYDQRRIAAELEHLYGQLLERR